MGFNTKSVNVHQFAMIPRADIPRASFNIQTTHKTTFDAAYLIPVFCEEILPGDTMRVNMTAYARLSTPIFPIMDNMYLDSFFFFVPNRLVWNHWQNFMGEQINPGDSTAYTIPQIVSPTGGFAVGSIYDYFGLPTVGQVGGGHTININALPFRAYNLIWREWFRDQNLQTSPATNQNSDGPDTYTDYVLKKRGKRHDYFTSALPWPQKGATGVSIPLGTTAPVKTSVSATVIGSQAPLQMLVASGGGIPTASLVYGNNASGQVYEGTTATGALQGTGLYPSNLYADLSAATSATINQLRQSFQIQKLLERDARGGTRYIEIIRAHFGVMSPDARLQRPEYLGGGSSPINISPIAQTSASNLTGGSTPLGNLAAIGTAVASRHGFSQSFVEHGYVIGLVMIRADLNYQQGIRKMWSRQTRYDFYFPAFAMLGEQAVLNREIYADGSAADSNVFGYQERWAEYRYSPSKITGLFRSTSAGTLDAWHLAQRFASLPTLNATFIEETPPVSRVLAVNTTNAQFLFDSFFDIKATRPMPLYSVPGLIDHF